VTFHSLEDRIVKRFLATRGGREPARSRHLPPSAATRASFEIVNQRPISPGEEEIAANPRSRSAKLRAAVRTTAPAHEEDLEEIGVPPVARA